MPELKTIVFDTNNIEKEAYSSGVPVEELLSGILANEARHVTHSLGSISSEQMQNNLAGFINRESSWSAGTEYYQQIVIEEMVSWLQGYAIKQRAAGQPDFKLTQRSVLEDSNLLETMSQNYFNDMFASNYGVDPNQALNFARYELGYPESEIQMLQSKISNLSDFQGNYLSLAIDILRKEGLYQD